MFVFVNNNFVMSYLKEKQGPTKTHNLVLSSTKLIFLIYMNNILIFCNTKCDGVEFGAHWLHVAATQTDIQT